jgi:hypothetical protein
MSFAVLPIDLRPRRQAPHFHIPAGRQHTDSKLVLGVGSKTFMRQPDKCDATPLMLAPTDERQDESLVYRLQGDLLNATGDQAAAERSYRRALAVADRQNAKALELRAATSLARLWRDQGKRTEAQ